MMIVEYSRKRIVLSLRNILKHDHWCSSIIYYALIIW